MQEWAAGLYDIGPAPARPLLYTFDSVQNRQEGLDRKLPLDAPLMQEIKNSSGIPFRDPRTPSGYIDRELSDAHSGW